jgi:hypothetical protein
VPRRCPEHEEASVREGAGLPAGHIGRLEVEHIGFSSLGDPEYWYAVHNHHGEVLASGDDLRPFGAQEPDARVAMRTLLGFLQAAAAEYAPGATPGPTAAAIPMKAGAWAAAVTDELAAVTAEINAELSDGLDR